jgi:hypothetical protein
VGPSPQDVLKEREPHESLSMEADYQDFMSIEIDEGDVDIPVFGMQTRTNQLSSLSPDSPKDSDHSMGEGRQKIQGDFKCILNPCEHPFEFAGDDDFDVVAMQREIALHETDYLKTTRKQSSFSPESKVMQAIQQQRKYSMQVFSS